MDNHKRALFEALNDGPASVAEIAKKSKLSKEEVETHMSEWHTGRLWVDRDDSGKTTRYQLTDAGRGALSASYGDTGTPGGSTDGSTSFGEYNRSHV